MKAILVLLIAFALTSCGDWCKQKNIINGKSNQHHDSKKFRVMWVKQYGHFCKVRYENEKTSFNIVYENCYCKKLKVGTWINY